MKKEDFTFRSVPSNQMQLPVTDNCLQIFFVSATNPNPFYNHNQFVRIARRCLRFRTKQGSFHISPIYSPSSAISLNLTRLTPHQSYFLHSPPDALHDVHPRIRRHRRHSGRYWNAPTPTPNFSQSAQSSSSGIFRAPGLSSRGVHRFRFRFQIVCSDSPLPCSGFLAGVCPPRWGPPGRLDGGVLALILCEPPLGKWRKLGEKSAEIENAKCSEHNQKRSTFFWVMPTMLLSYI